MKTQLPPRDWQQLSDFLDGQLSPREQADLEKRMLAHADLRTGLEELRQTRTVLRAAPHRRAPRNFTLKPDMVSARRTFWRGWTPTFSFASVAAALVAGVMLLGQLMPRVAMPMMATAPEAMPMEAPAMAQDSLEATPMIITWGDQSPPGTGGGGGYGGGPAASSGVIVTEPDLSAEKAAEPTPEAVPTDILPQPQTEATQDGLTLAPPVVEEAQAENLILGIAPEEEQGLARTPQTLVTDSQREAHRAINWRSWLTGGLIGLAVIFAGLAIYLRRR
jgi:hypothetical protein